MRRVGAASGVVHGAFDRRPEPCRNPYSPRCGEHSVAQVDAPSERWISTPFLCLVRARPPDRCVVARCRLRQRTPTRSSCSPLIVTSNAVLQNPGQCSVTYRALPGALVGMTTRTRRASSTRFLAVAAVGGDRAGRRPVWWMTRSIAGSVAARRAGCPGSGCVRARPRRRCRRSGPCSRTRLTCRGGHLAMGRGRGRSPAALVDLRARFTIFRDAQHLVNLRDRQTLRPPQPADISPVLHTRFLPSSVQARVSRKLVNFGCRAVVSIGLPSTPRRHAPPDSCRPTYQGAFAGRASRTSRVIDRRPRLGSVSDGGQ